MGAVESEEAIEDRAPSAWYLDGANSPAFYRTGRAVIGRPYVMVHKGERTRACVGAFTAVGPDVVLMVGGNHRIDWVPTFAVREMYDLPGAFEGNPASRGDIEIGADVTLGRGTRVLSGVTIGPGAVVAPHTVVTKDVRPFAVVAGCPAREVGRRFPDADVARLLDLAWWEWPAERVIRELHPAAATWRALRSEIDDRKPRTEPPVDLTRPRHLAGRTLRGVARRVDPQPTPPTPPDIPTDPWSYDPSLLSIGWGRGSSCPPIVHHDGSGRYRATIGNFCSVAYDCELVLDAGARPSHLSAVALGLEPDAGPGPPAGGDILVGSDVWLTRGTRILPGVTIGHGAVVAAYAVVTEDVRPYAIVAGNPARETSRRFDDATVEALLGIAWWEWSEDLVRERYADLCTPDVRTFVERYRARV